MITIEFIAISVEPAEDICTSVCAVGPDGPGPTGRSRPLVDSGAVCFYIATSDGFRGSVGGLISVIAPKSAEGRRVAKELRNISQVANRGVVFDRVSVVEMKTVMKMVRIRREKPAQ